MFKKISMGLLTAASAVLTMNAPAKAATININPNGAIIPNGGFSNFVLTQSGSTVVLLPFSTPVTSQFTVNSGSGIWKVNNLCLGIPNGNTSLGQVQLETCGTGGGAFEAWEFENGQVRSIPAGRQNGFCLDLQGGSVNQGTRATLAACSSTSQTQLFWPSGMTLNIVNRETYAPPSHNPPFPAALDTGSNLDNNGYSDPGGIQLQPWTHTRANTDRLGEYWRFSGNLILWAGSTDFQCLDVQGGALNGGAGQLFLNSGVCFGQSTAGPGGTPHYGQVFYMEPSARYRDSASVTIHNLLEFTTGVPSCLDILGNNTSAGNTVELAQCNSTEAQEWIIHMDAAYNAEE
jgi:hypothetical protein